VAAIRVICFIILVRASSLVCSTGKRNVLAIK
jgi:hypothetical protein